MAFPIWLYDSWCLTDASHMSPRSLRLFGNSNIGYAERCNLHVPGQLSDDHAVDVAQIVMEATPPRVPFSGDVARAFIRYIGDTIVVFRVGDTAYAEYLLSFIWAIGYPPPLRAVVLPRPVRVPLRYNVSFEINCSTDAGEELCRAVALESSDPVWLTIGVRGSNV